MSPDRWRDAAPDHADIELDYALRRARLIRQDRRAVQRSAAVLAVLLGGVIVACLIPSVFLLDEPQVSGRLVGAAVSLVGGLTAGAIVALAALLGFRHVPDSVPSREAVLIQTLFYVLVAPIGSLAVYLLTTTFLLEGSFVAEGYRPQAVYFVAFISGMIAPKLMRIRFRSVPAFDEETAP